jgi:hypothetical protein
MIAQESEQSHIARRLFTVSRVAVQAFDPERVHFLLQHVAELRVMNSLPGLRVHRQRLVGLVVVEIEAPASMQLSLRDGSRSAAARCIRSYQA